MKTIHTKLLIVFTITLCTTTQAITLKQMLEQAKEGIKTLEQAGEGITKSILKLFEKQKKSNIDNHLRSAAISGILAIMLGAGTYKFAEITYTNKLGFKLLRDIPSTAALGLLTFALGAYSISQIRKWEEQKEQRDDTDKLLGKLTTANR